MKEYKEKWIRGWEVMKKVHKDKYKSPPVGFSLSRTTSDNGCGIHKDKRLKRKHTRGAQNREWQAEQES